MASNNNERLKALADFSLTVAYQHHLKPYLGELLAIELQKFDSEPMTEFDSVKRDIGLMTSKRIIRTILNKIDNANDELSKKLINKQPYE